MLMGLPHLGQRGTSPDGTRMSRCSDTMTVRTASSAARSFGKWNSPVEMQQNATLLRLCRSARARQERQQEHSSASSRSVGLPGTMGTDGVQDVFAGQVVRGRELRPAGLLLSPLFGHDGGTFQPELDPGGFSYIFLAKPRQSNSISARFAIRESHSSGIAPRPY